MEAIRLEISRTGEADVLVAGGGVAGCCAALAAAREGARTMLVEQAGTLGGSATLSLVTPAGSRSTCSGISFGGMTEEIFAEVSRLSRRYCRADDEAASAPHILKYVLLDKLTKAGVILQLHSRVVQARIEGGRIISVALHTKSGIKQITAACFIDATGDADLASLAGDRCVIGCEPDAFQSLVDAGLDIVHGESGDGKTYRPGGNGSGMQPVSSMFVMGGVDAAKGEAYSGKTLTYADLGIDRAEFSRRFYFNTPGFEDHGDRIPLPQGRILFFRTCRKGEVVVNMSRVLAVDVTDEEQLTRGEIEAQKQVLALVDFLQTDVPGFENSYFIESSSLLGIRESRRLVGSYVLTGGDVITCRKFRDAVAHGSYIIDIHDPYGKRKAIGGSIRGDCYSIPYRSLISATIDNLAVAGRIISADHVAHSSTRIQGTCMMTGQAAGTAAALCSRAAIRFKDVPVPVLQERLRKQQVFLDIGNES